MSPITDYQRDLRQRHIGSSDAAAILGEDPWRSAYDVWLEKTGQLVEGDGVVNEAAGLGTMIEDSLLDWGAAQAGLTIIKNQRRVNGYLAANHDALVRDDPKVGFEAKTTGILTPFFRRDEWGDAGTDIVPDRVIIQCHHQMVVSGLSRVYVPALIGGRGRVMFVIDRNEDVAEFLRSQLTAWWESHVVAMAPPPDTLPSMETLKRVRRVPKSVCQLDDDLVERWRSANAAKLAAEKLEEEAKREMLTALGTNEAGECSGGLVTYFEHERRTIDTAALVAAHPELAEQFRRLTTYRKPHFKAAKEKS